MEKLPAPNELLIATDFSPCSMRALTTALSWWPQADATVLHVIDSELAQRIEEEKICSYEEAVRAMRRRAEEQLAELIRESGSSRAESMVVEGPPFVEIVKLANDLDCDLIVMGGHGKEGITEMFFGSTAEKVLRAARRPVLCVP